jgi:hypothetical protein
MLYGPVPANSSQSSALNVTDIRAALRLQHANDQFFRKPFRLRVRSQLKLTLPPGGTERGCQVGMTKPTLRDGRDAPGGRCDSKAMISYHLFTGIIHSRRGEASALRVSSYFVAAREKMNSITLVPASLAPNSQTSEMWRLSSICRATTL